MENIKTLEKKYFWLRFHLLVKFFLKNRKPTWVTALILTVISAVSYIIIKPPLKAPELTIELIITILTLFFVIVVWWVELREDWRQSLPKYLHARFFYCKKELKDMSDVRYARVIDEGDMRAHAQQIGSQKIVGGRLAIDASCYELKKILKYGLIEEYGEPEVFWHFIITTQLEKMPILKANNLSLDNNANSQVKEDKNSVVISVNDLYQGNAIQKEIPTYIAKIEEIAGNGKNIVLTGKAPIWLYLTLAHALHGKIKTLKYRSPEAEDILIMDHRSH